MEKFQPGNNARAVDSLEANGAMLWNYNSEYAVHKLNETKSI